MAGRLGHPVHVFFFTPGGPGATGTSPVLPHPPDPRIFKLSPAWTSQAAISFLSLKAALPPLVCHCCHQAPSVSPAACDVLTQGL